MLILTSSTASGQAYGWKLGYRRPKIRVFGQPSAPASSFDPAIGSSNFKEIRGL
jgi:hypothetical protein